MAKDMGVPLLAQIPINPLMVERSDHGELSQMLKDKDSDINQAYEDIVKHLEAS